MENIVDTYRKIIINRLYEISNLWKGYDILRDSINYTLLNCGKLVRSVLILLGLNDLKIDYRLGIDVSCALEMIQSYTLIHDDLPEMDNGKFRRSRRTNHLEYGHNIALLAGDALLTDAFLVLANANLDDDIKVNLTRLFATKAGSNGVCYGQAKDVTKNIDSNKKWSDIESIISYKTCSLFELATQIIGIIARFDNRKQELLKEIGYNYGLAFQIYDDLIDDNLDEIETYHHIYGKDNAKLKIEQLLKKTEQLCQEMFGKKNQIFPYLKSILR